MYCYIYDEFIQDKRFEKDLLRMENRLTDLGIQGKTCRLALFRNAAEMIRDEIGRGITTVVAVGNDETVRKVIDVVADKHVTFGIIPFGSPNLLAKLLGIPDGVAACDVLSARIVEEIDLGMVNGRRFVSGLAVPDFTAELTVDDKYRIRAISGGTLEVRNLAGAETVADPRDGLFETVIRVTTRTGLLRRKRTGETVLPLRSLAIRSEQPINLLADGEQMTATRFDVALDEHRLSVITGKGRMF